MRNLPAGKSFSAMQSSEKKLNKHLQEVQTQSRETGWTDICCTKKNSKTESVSY